MRGCLGGGEVSGQRAGVNEEPLQEAAGSVGRFGAEGWGESA